MGYSLYLRLHSIARIFRRLQECSVFSYIGGVGGAHADRKLEAELDKTTPPPRTLEARPRPSHLGWEESSSVETCPRI